MDNYQLLRNIALVAIMGLILKMKGTNPFSISTLSATLSTSKTTIIIFIRTFVGLLYQFAQLKSLELIPLSTSMVILMTSAFWVSILAFFINGEPILGFELLGMMICFGAVVVIATSSQEETIVDEDATEESQGLNPKLLGIILAMSAAWFIATQNVINRVAKSMDPLVLLFYYGLIGTLLWGVITFQSGSMANILTYSDSQCQQLFAAVGFDLLYCFANLVAFQSGSSGFVGLISYLTIIYSFICDSLIFKKTFSVKELSSIIVILLVTVVVSVYKLRTQARSVQKQKQTFV